MISNLIRRFIAGPIAAAAAKLPFEPVRIAGAAIIVITFLRDQLSDGADLETALTATLIFFGGELVRSNVWPSVKVDESGVPAEPPLEAPITGVEED